MDLSLYRIALHESPGVCVGGSGVMVGLPRVVGRGKSMVIES